MVIQKYRDWKTFRGYLLKYAAEPKERREQLAFRGLPDSNWHLETTLDRERRFSSDTERDVYLRGLLDEFHREALRMVPAPTLSPGEEAFELLARHHGVPSPLLDWSESPYIASFFAFDGAVVALRSSVSIWVLDRAKLPLISGGVDLIDDRELIRFNRRALEQRGLFTRITTIRVPAADLLAGALTKVIIPSSSKHVALADLDEMGINAASLFSDLDGAARTARYRLNP